ncbi:neutral/alkaline non-lysosomal ceramidase N-terminal domain-containing protein [Novosphingobium terrae]|uniref:neutral/alkaline non-lysosomal ceramidase N-terminal domain-containing protein n=1 Tax=Novosphingobium terrae TaxID=2726189 RepID=UPI00197F4A60|nr:neutral/alkaline non-lysosomal ceramidase N-terminal domain-containing protein [Novosphingobium terrae]
MIRKQVGLTVLTVTAVAITTGALAQGVAASDSGGVPSLSAAGAAGFVAGAAKVDISPPANALLHGDRLHDPLNVRAIYVGSGPACAVLVGMDQGNALNPVVATATAQITARLGCPAENVVISATHTHSGNAGGLDGGNSPNPAPQRVADAIVQAATAAKAAARAARVGYGTTQVNLNVNRDFYDGNMWMQAPNRVAPSDKTLAVVEFIDARGMPIGVYMNYAMHPINFYLSGVISADFPGAASNYIEKRFPGAVAVFTQGPSGDQNPLFTRSMLKLSGLRTRSPFGVDQSVESEDGWVGSAHQANANTAQTTAMNTPMRPDEIPAWEQAIAETTETVNMMGALIGESAIDVMRNLTPERASTGVLRGAQANFTCPGRDRLDPTARQGTLPPYKDGEPVNLKVGVLRIGNIYLSTVNGEVFNEIGQRLKREAPESRLMMVTLANGRANSGYIYSNAAAEHLSFQVIGSRLKPGCAEDKIVDHVLTLLSRSR